MISQPIISNPKHGWCTFTIDDFTGTPSYLTYVPDALLDAIITYLKNGIGAVVFDEEGSEFTFILEEFESFIISERSDIEYINIKQNATDIIDNIVNCIKNNLDLWAEFNVIENTQELFQKSKTRNQNKLIQKLKTIQTLRQPNKEMN